MKWSRKGSRDNTIKLVWIKYYKYVVEGTEYYFKQKAYATYCDGWIDSQRIVKRTYMNAMKKGKECIEIILQKDMELAEIEHLVSIFSERHDIPKAKMQGHIKKAMAAIKFSEEQFDITPAVEYTMFMMTLNHLINSEKEDNEQ